jgi:two-component system phosphate regulon response regulator OmpR
MKRILVIDDDLKLQELLNQYLITHGFETIPHYDGGGVVEKIFEVKPELIILDIMLPVKDGLEVLKEIRSSFKIAVIMLTARGEDSDRILGLEIGADDYLSKPFNPRELVARIKAVLRRGEPFAERLEQNFLEIDGVTVNEGNCTISKFGRSEELSVTELNLLKVLISSLDNALSRDKLLDLVRGKGFTAFDRSIDMHISKLRNKLEKIGDSKHRIRTVWGIGYMMVSRLG